MRLLLALLLIPTIGFGQIFIGPLTEGEYFNEVVYEGVYYSPGNCTWADGTDFIFDFNGLTEIDGMEYVLVIDTPVPANTTLINGWNSVNPGDSTAFTPTTSGLGISAASNAAELHFHIRLVGTPTTVGQTHPCWIDQLQTLANCDNVWYLLVGESPIACFVQTSIGLEDVENSISINVIDNSLKIESPEQGFVSILSADGKLISRQKLNSGLTVIDSPDNYGLTLIQVETGTTRFSKKILLHK